MIKKCSEPDFNRIYEIINESSRIYKGVIPEDRWKEPYMPEEELKHEIASQVVFYGYQKNKQLIGIMGIQDVEDVTLIRHAYIDPDYQRLGIGKDLLSHLIKLTAKPILIGTWKHADWAIRFYEKNGFRVTDADTKEKLLKKYWSIPGRQVETSVVLVQDTSG